MEKTLKVIEVKIENFKNIESLDLKLDGKSVYLIGGNRVGKTSAIQAIWGALSQKAMPESPLMQGKTTGSVIVVMGNDQDQYIIKRILSEGNVSLEIQNTDGFKTTQVKVLKDLIGDIDFDVDHFIRLSKTIPGKREQVEIIKSMLDPEVISSLSSLEQRKKIATESKSESNILLRDRKGLLNSLRDEPMEKNPIDTAKLRADLEVENKRERKRQEIMNEIESCDYTKLNAQKAIKDAETTIADCDKKDGELAEALGELPEFDASEDIKKELAGADAHNEKFRTYERYEKVKGDIAEYTDLVEKGGVVAAEIEKEIKKVVSESEFPIKDLEITEDGLLYKGLPFDDTALSTSEQLQVGVQLAIAKNPNAKIIKIPQAESLEKVNLDELIAYAEKEGYQLFVERVTDGEQLVVKIIE